MRQFVACKWRTAEADPGMAWPQRLRDHSQYLRSFGIQFQAGLRERDGLDRQDVAGAGERERADNASRISDRCGQKENRLLAGIASGRFPKGGGGGGI